MSQGNHGDDGQDDWYEGIAHLVEGKIRLPKGEKPMSLKGMHPQKNLGTPNVKTRWYEDWGMWAWLIFFGLIVLFIFTQPYRFGQLLGWILMLKLGPF